MFQATEYASEKENSESEKEKQLQVLSNQVTMKLALNGRKIRQSNSLDRAEINLLKCYLSFSIL
jgi:hypothetical protein